MPEVASSELGLSLTKDGKYCVILEPPVGRAVGKVIVANLSSTHSKSAILTAEVLNTHRSVLGISDTQQLKHLPPGSSSNVLNYHFVHDVMKKAVNSGSFTIDAEERLIEFKYIINGVTCKAGLELNTQKPFGDVTRCLVTEIHRCYEQMHVMKESAISQGIDISLIEPVADIAAIERVQQAEARRRNLSTVNPTQRAAKKITKGFGPR
jgi:hypothetical protein